MSNAVTRCPITYEIIEPGQRYSQTGIRMLAPHLRALHDLPFSAEELRLQAIQRAPKMSIQGVQLKLSAILKSAEGKFQIVDSHGRFILKPPHDLYPEVPENEDLSMRLAAAVGIEVPLHGMIYAKDGSRVYFIQRFDRGRRDEKLALEDFAQLSGATRDTKYRSSMEKVARIIETYATFPVLEKRELLLRVLFNYLIGNEDMHLKNFSMLMRDDTAKLSPAYDFLNTTIALGNAKEELALPLRGKKSNLKRGDFIDYYGAESLQLDTATIQDVLHALTQKFPTWDELIAISFLSESMKDQYATLLRKRRALLGI